MWGLVAIQVIIAFVFFILGWAVRFKKAYYLISGFSSRPETEQQQLIANGSPQKTGSLLIITAVVLLLLLPLNFTSFIYAMEVQFGGMLFMLLGGFIYLSKYEVASKRKRSYTISTVIFVVVFGSVAALSIFSYQANELKVQQDHFEITGMYGDEWKITEIKSLELMEEMPKVTARTNGVGLPTLSKGHFRVNDYGSSLLFIHKGSAPYLYIELENKHIFINAQDPLKTKAWYEALKEQLEK